MMSWTPVGAGKGIGVEAGEIVSGSELLVAAFCIRHFFLILGWTA